MSGRLSTWSCPECGGTKYSWYFEDPDGNTLCAELDAIPDMSGLEAAKQKARREQGATAIFDVDLMEGRVE